MGSQATFVGTTIVKSSQSLRKLRLGQEALLLNDYAVGIQYDPGDLQSVDLHGVCLAAENYMKGASPSFLNPGLSLCLALDSLRLVAVASYELVQESHSLMWRHLRHPLNWRSYGGGILRVVLKPAYQFHD